MTVLKYLYKAKNKNKHILLLENCKSLKVCFDKARILFHTLYIDSTDILIIAKLCKKFFWAT